MSRCIRSVAPLQLILCVLAFLVGCDPAQLVIYTGEASGPNFELSAGVPILSYEIDIWKSDRSCCLRSLFANVEVYIAVTDGESNSDFRASLRAPSVAEAEGTYMGDGFTLELEQACTDQFYPEPEPRSCRIILDLELVNGAGISGGFDVGATASFIATGSPALIVYDDVLEIDIMQL